MWKAKGARNLNLFEELKKIDINLRMTSRPKFSFFVVLKARKEFLT